MLSNFQKTFKPTESDKEERTIKYLSLLIDSIKCKDCCTCKNGEPKEIYEHGNETVATYCKIANDICIACSGCKNYEVDEERLWK